MIVRKSARDIEAMRAAGKLVARCLREISEFIVPGQTTTMDVDVYAESLVHKYGVIGSFKGYRGYPNTICVAVNEEVVHGIPGNRILSTGDIVGLDLGLIVDGWHADSAITVAVGGECLPEAERLMKVTREALYKGIEQARPGKRIGDIGYAIQSYVEKHGYSVVRALVGHGVGKRLHEEPNVPNFGRPKTDVKLEEGMTLAIEPMVNMGSYEVETLADKWTVVSKDRSLSAHFEHTVAIRKNGPDILTIDTPEGG